MFKLILFFVFTLQMSFASESFKKGIFEIIPIEHGSFVLKMGDKMGFVDPVGNAERFSKYGQADFILITDIHGDHLDLETLQKVSTERTLVYSPAAVFAKTQRGKVIQNGESISFFEGTLMGIPMYNTTEGRLEKHIKGRGNGYLIEFQGQRFYLSGDTEDIPEMRALKEIDIALLCMNLPYTMTPEQALSAALEFRPKVLIPFHYRGKPDYSDLTILENELGKHEDIELVLLEWYPNRAK